MFKEGWLEKSLWRVGLLVVIFSAMSLVYFIAAVYFPPLFLLISFMMIIFVIGDIYVQRKRRVSLEQEFYDEKRKADEDKNIEQ